MSDELQQPPAGLVRLGGTPSLVEYLRSVWARREFALSMALGELRSQHMDTTLGALWHLLNPVLLTAVYGLIFGLILAGSRPENFVAYLSIGVFLYSFGQRCTTSGAGSIVSNVGLIRSLQFPRALLPASAVIRETYAFGWSALVMVGVLLASGVFPTVRWLLFLPIFALLVVFSMGLALTAARLTDRTRDIQNVLPFIFRLGFYMSGILFPVERFITDPTLQRLFVLNPFYAFISLARHQLLGPQPFPSLLWLSVLVWTPLALIVGTAYFRRGEKGYGRG